MTLSQERIIEAFQEQVQDLETCLAEAEQERDNARVVAKQYHEGERQVVATLMSERVQTSLIEAERDAAKAESQRLREALEWAIRRVHDSEHGRESVDMAQASRPSFERCPQFRCEMARRALATPDASVGQAPEPCPTCGDPHCPIDHGIDVKEAGK